MNRSLVLKLPDGVEVTLDKAVASIGSDPACDVVLDGLKKSHALVFRDGARWSATPAAKGCEVRLNGKRVEVAALEPGAKLGLGKLELEVRAESSPAMAAGLSSAPALAAFASRLLAQRPARELLDSSLAGIVEAAGADVGCIVGFAPEGAAILSAVGDVPAGLISDSLIARVQASGAPVLAADIEHDAALAGAPSLRALRFTSAIAIPLRAPGREDAVIYLGRKAGRPSLGSAELDVATALSSLAALLLGTAKELADLRQEVLSLTRRVSAATFEGMVGESPAMRELYRRIEKLAPTGLNVLIHGETGTGKELVARAIHRRSGRRGPFVALSCAAIPEGLIERELFGHVRGAYSGATSDRMGVFEAAHGGTLFLDELGDMPPPVQVKLLRVVQERELTRLGDTRARKVDVRLVTATHVNLKEAVKAGEFREDLLFRVDEVRIDVPSLRSRGEDVLLIAHQILSELTPRKELTQKATEAILGHPFPGNVRQLISVLRRASALSTSPRIGPEELALEGVEEPLRPLEEAKDAFVKRYVREAISRCDGSKKDAAKALGIGLRSLFRYLEE